MQLDDELEQAVWDRRGTRAGSEVRFCCPTHDDEHPSASWNPTKQVWFCHVCGKGGGKLDLARRLNLTTAEPNKPGLTLEELADAKGLPLSLLRKAGMREGVHGTERSKCVDIPYITEQGIESAVHKRVSLDGALRFVWRRGDNVLPYGLWHLEFARALGSLVIVEGETDAVTLWHAGIASLGLPGAGTWKEAWKHHFQGIDRIYLWCEPDKGGDTLLAKVAQDIPEVLVIEAPAGIKDPNALWLSLGCDVIAFVSRMKELIASARRHSELRSETLGAEAREMYTQARTLLEDPDLIERLKRTIKAAGYAGDPTPALLAYVSLTSRHLERPLNLALIAQSASGKNRAVDAALALVPEEAYYLEKAGSARALIYADVDFQHRIVIVAEADSIPEDGPAASAIRSLAADSYMAYDVVEKDQETGQFVTRRVEKPGPTGLVTTYTRPLPEQLGTRMLSVSVSDTPGQTRAVLLAHASSVNGELPAPDTTPFIALQRWLAIAGDHKVTVPFASALAELVPDKHVRMRRDFRQLLTVIQALALLHQRRRQRDSHGSVVAELEDYELARELLLDTFSAAASGGITTQVRETVQALLDIYDGKNPVTIKALGDRLGLARDTAWHRVNRASALGHMTNQETRKGQPAKLVPGDPLPAEGAALPTVEELQTFMCAGLDARHSTVQPEPARESAREPEAPVESTVEPDIQPGFQPQLPGAGNSDRPAQTPPVERLNADPAPENTHPLQHDKAHALALAEEHLFPCLELKAGVVVMAGKEQWQKFVEGASPDFLHVAIERLERHSIEGDQ